MLFRCTFCNRMRKHGTHGINSIRRGNASTVQDIRWIVSALCKCMHACDMHATPNSFRDSCILTTTVQGERCRSTVSQVDRAGNDAQPETDAKSVLPPRHTVKTQLIMSVTPPLHDDAGNAAAGRASHATPRAKPTFTQPHHCCSFDNSPQRNPECITHQAALPP